MKLKAIILPMLLTATVWTGSYEQSWALPSSPTSLPAAQSEGSDIIVQVRARGGRGGFRGAHVRGHSVRVTRHGVGRHVRVGVVRPWRRRPYFGTVVAGVTLGTIIAATAAPAAPGSNVCWYWSNSSQTRGYWDYCQ